MYVYCIHVRIYVYVYVYILKYVRILALYIHSGVVKVDSTLGREVIRGHLQLKPFPGEGDRA